MQLRYLMAMTALALSAGALAADSTERSAPQDRNPACMDRKTDSSTGDCVVQDEGTPRQTYPPKKKTPVSVTPAPLPAAAAVPATVRKAPATGK